MSDQALVRLESISKSFAGVRALADVSLSIGRGEIHCLAGENGSGKSTLIKILAGALAPDRGEVVIGGKPYRRLHPIDAIREGIQIIYQDFSLFPNLTVAENIALNRQLAEGRRLVSWREVREIAQAAVDKLGVKLELDARVESLPVADKQLVAIARALLHDARLIVMDEPTTALTEKEVRSLLGIIKRLQRDGVAILFVSHKLNEVFEVSETITILRNGHRVAGGAATSFDWESLAFHMTGRQLNAKTPPRQLGASGESLLSVSGLSKRGHFEDVSFDLRRGEVLAVAGLLGSGRTALAMALFGLTPVDAGSVRIEGRGVKLRSVQDAVAHGIGYVPEDRLSEGLFLPQSIGNNIVVGKFDGLLGRFGLLSAAKMARETEAWVKRLNVVTPSPHLPVQSLSGGNQQRVVLARWLATSPNILILNGPTVGVDIGSKADIHGIIGTLVGQGMGVLIISDDIPELMHTCHRLLIMKAGRITGEYERAAITENELALKLAS